MVPLFDIKAQHAAIEHELNDAFARVLHSGHFILGPEVLDFEKQIAGFVGSRHAIGVSSGTDAILLALMSLGIGPGDEVICPSFTFFATAGCVSRVGAKPVFVDSCPVCFNLDVHQLPSKVTPRTKAIIPVHLFGQAAEMDAVIQFARQHNLAVIEDAAQALGASYRGQKVGGIGTVGTFSFFPTKNLGGFGDAGILVTDDDALADRARALRTHGSERKYYHEWVGANFRIDAVQAALLRVKLRYYESYTEKRRANAAYYAEKLGALAGVGMAEIAESQCGEHAPAPSGASGAALRIILPVAYAHNDHIWNQYTIRVSGGQRDDLRQFLADHRIGSEVYYPVPLHRQKCFLPADLSSPSLPVCERVADECLSLPIFPELTRKQQDAVVDAIAAFVGKTTAVPASS